jgi:hypothetical protein
VEPVQCYGLRNGTITIKKIFGGLAPYYYSIDGQSFSTNPTFDYLWAGNYTLYVRDGSGCVKTQELALSEPPELIVRLLAEDSSIVAGMPVSVRALISPETANLQSIEWRPPALFQQQGVLQQQLSLSESTNLAIELVDQNGCYARSYLSIEVAETSIYIPNAIKPGSAQDAYFTVYAGDGVKRVVYLKVYSRFGAVIFDGTNFAPNDPLKGWNGRWRNQKAQPGVYLWLAAVELLDGKIKHFKGTVTVVE